MEIIENDLYTFSPYFTTTYFPPKYSLINPFTPSVPFCLPHLSHKVLTYFNETGQIMRDEFLHFPDSVFDPVGTHHLLALSDRVSSLESRFDRMLRIKEMENGVDRKFSWTAEIKGDNNVGRKYKWTAEIERDGCKKGKVVKGERKYEWRSEIKNGGGEKRVYTWKSTIGGGGCKKSGKNIGKRIVEINDEQVDDRRSLMLRKAFAKRISNKGKKKELLPFDAAALIQWSFRGYLLRRSQALRALRELAVAKTKLKELRTFFHNFSYRSRISRDAEERQKFSEKIIVLLLTVDAIQGVDLMVRAAKRSMVDELEAMLDVVDPQPGTRLSMRRRTFNMPSGIIQKELAEGVAQVVQMLDESNATFEACL